MSAIAEPESTESGFQAGRYAAIDIGTVTCRMLVADVDEAGRLHELDREYTITNLGESIEASDLSLADIERRKSHPGHWALFIALVLVALIAPYWWGRVIAVKDAAWMVANLSFLDPKGVALISWTVTIMAMAGLGLMVADVKKWLWGTVFVVGLAAEQFVAGVCLLSFNFWNATYVMYGDSSGLANAANLGIIAAGCGVAFYAVLWVGLLVCIKKESKFNVLTRSWASFLLFFAIEIIALAVVLFGGLLNVV